MVTISVRASHGWLINSFRACHMSFRARRGSQQIAVVLSIGCPLEQGEPGTGQLNQVRKIGVGLTTQMHRNVFTKMGSGSMETKEKEKGPKRSRQLKVSQQQEKSQPNPYMCGFTLVELPLPAAPHLGGWCEQYIGGWSEKAEERGPSPSQAQTV